jgi:hypothetical protein
MRTKFCGNRETEADVRVDWRLGGAVLALAVLAANNELELTRPGALPSKY